MRNKLLTFSLVTALVAAPAVAFAANLVGSEVQQTTASTTTMVGLGGGQVFVNTETGDLQALDGSTPSNLNPLGAGIPETGELKSIVKSGNWLLAAAGSAGLVRYQFNPTGDPVFWDSYTTGGNSVQVAVMGTNAVVADQSNGLVIISFADPTQDSLTLVGHVAPPMANDDVSASGDFHHLDVQGNFAYIGDDNGAFRIYDLTDPSAPMARGWLEQSGILDVKVSGNYAYLALGESGIQVVDISNPDLPTMVGAPFELTGGPVGDLAENLSVQGKYLLVAAENAGVHVLNILPNGGLSLNTTVPTTGNASQLAVSAGSSSFTAFAASLNGGLSVVKFLLNPIFIPSVSR